MAKSFSKDTPSLFGVIFGLLVSAGLIYLYVVYAIPELKLGYEASTFFYIVVLIVYVIISYVVHPQVDYSNQGLFGGLMDDPTTIEDDINRKLDFLKKLLYPGKLIAWSIIGLIKLIKKD